MAWADMISSWPNILRLSTSQSEWLKCTRPGQIYLGLVHLSPSSQDVLEHV